MGSLKIYIKRYKFLKRYYIMKRWTEAIAKMIFKS